MPCQVSAQTAATSAPKESAAKDAKEKAPAAAPAEESLPSVPAPNFPKAQAKLESLKQSLDQIEATLHNRHLPEATLTDLREQVATTQNKARELIAAVTTRLEADHPRDPARSRSEGDGPSIRRRRWNEPVAGRNHGTPEPR